VPNIFPIPALADNYIWCLHNDKDCVVVDPGEADPVFAALKERNLALRAILVTHHHYDHTGGIHALTQQFKVPVIGPKAIAEVTAPIQEHQKVAISSLQLTLQHCHIPGHTLEHVAYYTESVVFTGDTLFTGGCGRIFEGTVEQMYHSLMQIKALPDATLVYCGHEYTENNLKFALKVEPRNQAIHKRFEETIKLRQESLPTVPASLAIEKQTNPFLRCDHPDVIQAASKYSGRKLNDPIQVLAVVREWKNVSP
jgi:hydroxyacylglutathione hydrolase